MHIDPAIHKKLFRTFPVLLLLLVSLGMTSFAQEARRLPDSVSTSDSVSPEIVNPVENPTVIVDTTPATTTTEASRETTPDTTALRAVPPSVVKSMKEDPDFAYANDPEYWRKIEDKPEPGFLDWFFKWITGKWFKDLVYLLLGSVLLFALYKIVVENKLYLFYGSSSRRKAAASEDGEVEPENLDERIKEAAGAGDYRTAIRYLYLKALHRATENNWIKYHARHTDEDYVRQMQGHSLGTSFRQLASVYQYVWYGGFGITRDQYQTIAFQFDQFYNYRQA
jgi:hypothetical protein